MSLVGLSFSVDVPLGLSGTKPRACLLELAIWCPDSSRLEPLQGKVQWVGILKPHWPSPEWGDNPEPSNVEFLVGGCGRQDK